MGREEYSTYYSSSWTQEARVFFHGARKVGRGMNDMGVEEEGCRARGVTDRSQSSRASGTVSSLWGLATRLNCHMALLAMSHTVSDIVQKVGGDCTHPMVQAMGMPTGRGSPGHFCRMMLSRKLSWARKNSQWNPSLMPCSLVRTGPNFWLACRTWCGTRCGHVQTAWPRAAHEVSSLR